MGARTLEELVTWRLLVAFKEEVYRLIDGSPTAKRDYKWRDQLKDAALSAESNVAEGFHRFRRKQMLLFYGYARGSHAEAEKRLKDGIARRHFTDRECEPGLRLAKRSGKALLELIKSIERLEAEGIPEPKPPRGRQPPSPRKPPISPEGGG
jgi:four helix bundle protein